MYNDFEKIFDRLVNEVSKPYGDGSALSNVIDEIINHFNKEIGKTFKSRHVTKDKIESTMGMAFMYASGDVINHSVHLIREIQNRLKSTKMSNYDPGYSDITYSMFLIDSIAHEFWHCKQYEDNINGVLNEQTYLNSLCYAISTFAQRDSSAQINYLDRPFEGDAYGKGVAIMKKLCGNLKNQTYKEAYQKQMAGWNFFKKNSMYHEAVYYLNVIPFMNTKNGFSNIIMYVNRYLSSVGVNNKEWDELLKRYPSIMVGLEEEKGRCRIKNSDELMGQYFGNYIKFCGKKCNLNRQEKTSLNDIYIYLLMPQLTPEIYNNLCMKYGCHQMDFYMLSLQQLINKKIELYKVVYENSLIRIKKIRITDKTILQNIDEEYAKNKYEAAIIYLNECNKKIDNLIKIRKTFNK